MRPDWLAGPSYARAARQRSFHGVEMLVTMAAPIHETRQTGITCGVQAAGVELREE